jgi:hypothetical protein
MFTSRAPVLVERGITCPRCGSSLALVAVPVESKRQNSQEDALQRRPV